MSSARSPKTSSRFCLQIIQEVNKRFGTDFSEEDKVFIEHLQGRLAEDASLEAILRVHTLENARLTFDIVANDRIQECVKREIRTGTNQTENE